MNVQERQALVRDFHRMTGEPINETPAPPDRVQAELRVALLVEEVLELAKALGVKVTAMLENGQIHIATQALIEQPDLVEAVDALRDIEYLVHGTELVLGVQSATDETFLEVHRSNMGKQPVAYGEKAVKPKGWRPPAIREVLRKMFPKKALLFRK